MQKTLSWLQLNLSMGWFSFLQFHAQLHISYITIPSQLPPISQPNLFRRHTNSIMPPNLVGLNNLNAAKIWLSSNLYSNTLHTAKAKCFWNVTESIWYYPVQSHTISTSWNLPSLISLDSLFKYPPWGPNFGRMWYPVYSLKSLTSQIRSFLNEEHTDLSNTGLYHWTYGGYVHKFIVKQTW